MKTNIIKMEINEQKLQENITEYELMNNQKPYLIMNEQTMGIFSTGILNHYKLSFPSGDGLNLPEKMIMYQGNKCYIDNDLAFGEVEIR